MKLLLGEIFGLLKEAKNNKEKADIIRTHYHPVIKEIFKINFDPNIKFSLPKGAVPYKVNDAPAGLSETNLWAEFRKMYLFLEGGHKTLTQPRREQLFIQLLEGLHHKDAALLVALKDKSIKGITKKLAEELFPEMFEKDEKNESKTDVSV